MTVIAKIDPPLIVTCDGVAHLHARPYKADQISIGEEIFVWTAKRSSGHGLAARGTVLETRIDNVPNPTGTGSHKELVLSVQITDEAPRRPLAIDQITPEGDAAPQANTARTNPRQALNKITTLEPALAAFVRSHFEEE